MLGKKRESPNIAVAQVEHDIAVKHITVESDHSTGSEGDGVDILGLRSDHRRRKVRSKRDDAKEDNGEQQQGFDKPVCFHRELLSGLRQGAAGHTLGTSRASETCS